MRRDVHTFLQMLPTKTYFSELNCVFVIDIVEEEIQTNAFATSFGIIGLTFTFVDANRTTHSSLHDNYQVIVNFRLRSNKNLQ